MKDSLDLTRVIVSGVRDLGLMMTSLAPPYLMGVPYLIPEHARGRTDGKFKKGASITPHLHLVPMQSNPQPEGSLSPLSN